MIPVKLIYEFYPIIFDYVLVVAMVFTAGATLTHGAARIFPRLRRHEYRCLIVCGAASFPLAAGPVGSVLSAVIFRLLTVFFGPGAFIHQWCLIAVWLTVGAVLWYRVLGGWRRTSRWVAGLPRADDDPVFDAAVREVMPGQAVTRKRSGPGGVVASWGGRRRVVLVPDGFSDAYSPEERRCIYLHELAHLRRRDSWFLLMAETFRCLFWFTPAARRAVGRIQEGIEIACDRAVLRRPGVERFTYAELILKAQVQGTALATGFSAAGAAEVRARIEQIVGSPLRSSRRLRDRAGMAASFALLLAFSVYGYGLNAEYNRRWLEIGAPYRDGGTIVKLPNGLAVRMIYTFHWRGVLNSYGSAYSEAVEGSVLAIPGGGSVTVAAAATE
ncbi:MAG: M56 family metallopeptidase [Planctomycetaceae bacterium]|nr:M56 family metallopeptidase [Planctomycetaceae bacterium]